MHQHHAPGQLRAVSSCRTSRLVTARAVARSLSPMAAIDASPQFRNFCRDEDPGMADECAVTVAQAMSGDTRHSSLMIAKPEWHYPRWHAVALNSQLSKPNIGMLYANPDCSAVAYAYRYPEEIGVKVDPPPAGFTDTAQWQRPEAAAAYKELIDFMAAGKELCLQHHGPFFYIGFLAVRPQSQGQGLGGRLLRQLLRRADEAGRWSYLEATNDGNVQLYQRHGFHIVDQRSWELPEVVPGARARLILMQRPPAAQPDCLLPFSAASRPEDAAEAANIIAQGFGATPSTAVYCSDPGHHVAWWHGIVHNNQLRMAQADIHYLMPNCAAIAYHYPDQKAKEQEGQGEPPGATDVSQWMRPEMKAQIPGLLQYMAEQQAAMLAERQPFFYIAFLAVRPEGQGQGLGARLLRQLLRRADEAGRWSYLEATNDRNVQLYQRHGFSIRSQSSWAVPDACPGLEVRLIAMERPPNAAQL